MKLHIITPVIRADNLWKIALFLPVGFVDVTWWTVFDQHNHTRRLPYLELEFINRLSVPSGQSVSGNAQRNAALEKIEDGYVWFLDDDTLPHPGLGHWLAAWNGAPVKAAVFGQLREMGREYVGPLPVKRGHIDMGQAVIRRDVIGKVRFNETLVDADGVFLEEVIRLPLPDKVSHDALSLYNWLR